MLGCDQVFGDLPLERGHLLAEALLTHLEHALLPGKRRSQFVCPLLKLVELRFETLIVGYYPVLGLSQLQL